MPRNNENVVMEIDTPNNANLYFRPLLRTVRGRFDLHRVAEPNAGKLNSLYPEPIPGQRIEFDCELGTGAIVEPLYEEQFAAIRERIEGLGQKLPPEREPISIDPATGVHWLKGLVDSGKAKLLSGQFPSKVEGKPQTRFHSTPAEPDTSEQLQQLLSTMVRLCELLAQKSE